MSTSSSVRWLAGKAPRHLGETEPPKLFPDGLRRAVHHRLIGVRVLVAEIQIVKATNWDDMEMDVRDLEARKHQAYAHRLEAGHLRPADRLRDRSEVAEEIRIDVDPVIDLLARDNQSVTGTQRAVGQEDHADVVLPHESRGQLPGDDAAENAAHPIRVSG